MDQNWDLIRIHPKYTQNTDRIHQKRRKYLLKSSNKCQKINLHPEKPHISHKVELYRTKIGIPTEYTQNTDRIHRIRRKCVIKSCNKCHKWTPHPKKPHISRITKQNRPKNGNLSLGRNWAIFGHVLAIISGSNLPISKIPKDLSPSYCHRAVEKKRMKIG